MAIIFADSFDHYNDGQLTFKDYSFTLDADTAYSIEDGAGRRGTDGLKTGPASGTSGGGVVMSQSLDTSKTTNGVIIGGAFKIGSNRAGPIFSFRDISSSDIATLRLEADGALSILLAGTTKASTPASFISLGSYQYFELKFIPDAASGLLEVKRNEVTILTFSGDTVTGVPSSGVVGEFRYIAVDVFNPANYDDIYVVSTDPATDNSDYLGDIRVDYHPAASEGQTIDMAPSQGTDNAAMVDEILPDEDTTFVQGGSIGDTDIYNVSTATLGTTILGIQQVALVKKTDAGTVEIQHVTKSSAGATQNHSFEQISDDYSYSLSQLDNDPDDSADWTDSKINDTDFGYKVKDIT